ncbi:MAG: TonB family protein [Gemmatimonadetes bacterium]|nr:TonB family protein [Gemmatimonadota bacterium]NIO32466.1 TonB family protein [Gemmatimonadota bacterium]
MKSGRRSEERLFGELLANTTSRAGKSTAVATLTSLAFHAVIVAGAVWATLAFGKEVIAEPEEQITLLELRAEVREPPPAPPIRRPEPPPPSQTTAPPAPEPEVVVEPEQEEVGGFQTLAEPEEVPDEIPASSGVAFDESDFSGEGVEGGRGGGPLGAEAEAGADNGDYPPVNVYTVAPVLINRAEVAEAMFDHYPRMLKRAGVSGVVIVRIQIDAAGRVVRSVIGQSSGRAGFDEAALEVAQVMSFKPALNGDQPVAAWVVMPIEFRVK